MCKFTELIAKGWPGKSPSWPLYTCMNDKQRKNKKLKKILVNYTNHPSAKWSSDQMAAAQEKWSKVIDIPFPQTEPEWGEKEVADCFDAFMSEVDDKLKPAGLNISDTEFLIMGEFRFTFYSVRTLLAMGNKVYAHAGKREVEIVDNKSIYTFRFGRFVEYF